MKINVRMGGAHYLNKKGFTLIELLAVIVILAIIALIATPIVLNIIEDSRKSASERSIELYKKSVENAVADYLMKNSNATAVTYDTIKDSVDYSGNIGNVTTLVNYDASVFVYDIDNNVGYGKSKLKGDVNCDGKVTAIDSVSLQQYNNGTQLSLCNEENADLNCDGKINSADQPLMQSILSSGTSISHNCS